MQYLSMVLFCTLELPFFCIHYEFCDHSVRDSLCETSSIVISLCLKNNNTILSKSCQNKDAKEMAFSTMLLEYKSTIEKNKKEPPLYLQCRMKS